MNNANTINAAKTTEWFLVAESSSGQVIREAWIAGETLKDARSAFWISLSNDEQDAVASIEETDKR